jgi:hypothetical protein
MTTQKERLDRAHIIIRRQSDYFDEMRKFIDKIIKENEILRNKTAAYESDYFSHILGIMLGSYLKSHPKLKKFSRVSMESFIVHVGSMERRNLINIEYVKKRMAKLIKEKP